MLGFELTINGEEISAALENGVVSLIATQMSRGMSNSVELDLRGLDTSGATQDEMIDWYSATLNDGDEVILKVKNITKNSMPQKREKRDSDDERKLKSYYLLKKELEDKELI
jgi:hypothetical protein